MGEAHPPQGLEERAHQIESQIEQTDDQGIQDECVEAREKRQGIQKIGQGETDGSRAEENDADQEFCLPPSRIALSPRRDFLPKKGTSRKSIAAARGQT